MTAELDQGTATENLVQELCRRSFLADFVFRSPNVLTASGKRREAGDLLIPLKQTLIAFQIRARTVEEDFDPENAVHLGRIKERIDHAVNQVKSAKRFLESGALRELTNLRGVRVSVGRATYTRHVGVVVLDLKKPARSSGNLDLCLINGLSEVRDIPVHVFLREDFGTVISEMDTIPDFLRYLEVRYSLMKARRSIAFTQELDLLAWVQTHYQDVQKVLSGKVHFVVLDSGLWEEHSKIHQKKIKERDERRLRGRIIDRFIERTHATIGHLNHDWGDVHTEAGSSESYFTIAQELACLSRVHRNEFGKKIIEKARKADHDTKGFSFCSYVARDTGTVFLFLASREPRAQALQRLLSFTCAVYVLMKRKRLAKRAVGLGTRNMSATEGAEDFLMIPEGTKFKNSNELAKLAKEIFSPLQAATVDEWGNRRVRSSRRTPSQG